MGIYKATVPQEQQTRIGTPYLGGAELLNVAPASADNGSWEALDFTFRATEGDQKGAVYNHREFSVDENDPKAQSKGENLVARLVYILSYFTTGDRAAKMEEIAAAINGALAKDESFDNLRNTVIKIAESLNYTAKTDLRMKLVGNVYRGKANVGFTGYIGFLADDRSEGPFNFGPNEVQQNAKYSAFRSTPSTDAGEVGGTSGSAWDFG